MIFQLRASSDLDAPRLPRVGAGQIVDDNRCSRVGAQVPEADRLREVEPGRHDVVTVHTESHDGNIRVSVGAGGCDAGEALPRQVLDLSRRECADDFVVHWPCAYW
jgi:hypothetical protein